MKTRCLTEWGEHHYEIYVAAGDAFDLVARCDAFSIFQVASKLARRFEEADFDAIRVMRCDLEECRELAQFWNITFERTASDPKQADQIIADYYVRRTDD